MQGRITSVEARSAAQCFLNYGQGGKKTTENIVDLVSLLMRYAEILQIQALRQSTIDEFSSKKLKIKLFRTHCTLY